MLSCFSSCLISSMHCEMYFAWGKQTIGAPLPVSQVSSMLVGRSSRTQHLQAPITPMLFSEHLILTKLLIKKNYHNSVTKPEVGDVSLVVVASASPSQLHHSLQSSRFRNLQRWSCSMETVSRQRSDQKQSSALLESSLPPEGRQRTPTGDMARRNCQTLPSAHKWKVADENTQSYPTFGHAANGDTVGVHPQHRAWRDSTRLGWDTGVPWIPSHGKFHSSMESHEPRLWFSTSMSPFAISTFW